MTDPKRGRWRIAVQVIAVAMLIDVTVSPAICPAPQRPVTPAPDVAPAASAPQGPATLTVNPAPGSRNVDPSTPIAVTASTGVLVAVQMVNETGKVIDGVLTPDQKMWKRAMIRTCG